MNYLLDKKIKRKKFARIIFFAAIALFLFYFRTGIFNSLSVVSHAVFRPVLFVGRGIGEKFGKVGAYFVSKNSLLLQNEKLARELMESEARMGNYDSILAENISLKSILGRSGEKNSMIVSAILSKPNQSPYDTLMIDVGRKQGAKIGDRVFAFGNIPIGTIAEAHSNSSKVVLFSTSGEKTQVVVRGSSLEFSGGGDVFLEVTGRGGGNFEMVMPRGFTFKKGDEAVLPGIVPYVLAVVETIISDPREPFAKVLLTSPVNIQELKFVEVEQLR